MSPAATADFPTPGHWLLHPGRGGSSAAAVNQRDELTLPQSIISMIYRADQHSDPAPNDSGFVHGREAAVPDVGLTGCAVPFDTQSGRAAHLCRTREPQAMVTRTARPDRLDLPKVRAPGSHGGQLRQGRQ